MPGSSSRHRVVVVGAGIAGIGLAIGLKRAGLEDFVVLESADRIGGVWRDNVYPGVACDIPRSLYSYSSLPMSGSGETFPTGPEIDAYLRCVVGSEGIESHVRLGEPMLAAEWSETERTWSVTTDRESLVSDALVLACGRQTVPRIQQLPGLRSFAGRVFHSSRWDSRPLSGLRVGVVGTGASAVQLVPHVAEQAATTVVFQRTPAWVLPRDGGSSPGGLGRADLQAEAEALFDARIHASAAARTLEERARSHLQAQVRDEQLRAALTPAYEIGCKRAVFSDDYFPTLQLPSVTLEASALAAVSGRLASAGSGQSYELDVLVFATGFDTDHPPYAGVVRGRGSRSLAEHWAQGSRTYASVAVHGFPNMFVVGGPNAALGHASAFGLLEAQIGYVVGGLEHLGESAGQLEVSRSAEDEHLDFVDRLAAKTVWTQGGCTSWYLDPATGRPSVLWPARVADFRQKYGVFDPAPYLEVPGRVAS